MAAGRGAMVLVVAVVIGIVLLNKVDEVPGTQVSSGGGTSDDTDQTTPTTEPAPVTTTVPARQPRDVKVLSANGTKVNGAGGRIRDVLKAVGYNVLAPIETKQPVQASVVYFTPGFEQEAHGVAQVLKLPPTSVQPLPAANALPVADLRGANVVAVVGPELARAPASTTTTTRRATTTTTRRATSTTAPPTTPTTTTPPG